MLKKQLHELFIITGDLDTKNSKVDINMLKNHVLSNWTLDNRVSDNDFEYLHEYCKVPYHQHIQWLQDYIRDHYRVEYSQTLVPAPQNSVTGIIQQTGEKVNTHQHINNHDLNASPDLSALFCVSTGEKETSVTFNYSDGRRKDWSWRVPIKTGQFILFSSELNHYIGKNENKDFLINLSFMYQLI